jgi:hypothetical protein
MQTTLRRFASLSLLILLALPLLAASLGSAPMNVKGLNLDLVSVERRGNVLTVKWAVTNTGSDQAEAKFALKGKHTTSYAVDEESGTKYYALTDKEGNLLASASEYVGSDSYGIAESIKPGETKRYWAKLPAPPPGVKAINILFTDTEPFEAVAITDK